MWQQQLWWDMCTAVCCWHMGQQPWWVRWALLQWLCRAVRWATRHTRSWMWRDLMLVRVALLALLVGPAVVAGPWMMVQVAKSHVVVEVAVVLV